MSYVWLGAFDTYADEIVVAPESLRHCVVCHGVELAGNRSVDAPNLSVLSPWYIERQLESYKSGLRAPHGTTADLVGREMQPMAAELTSSEVDRILQFAERVPERLALPTVDGDVERGAELYVGCAVCHGVEGEGNKLLNAPRLAGQSDWYLVRQLENYASGARGTAAGDTWGAQMRAAMSELTGSAAHDDVVSYINSLNR